MTAASTDKVPRHVAIVMDGNGRWAQQRNRPRSFGHHEGQKAVRGAVEFCLQRKIEALTLFAFSSENWKRPQTEVGALMSLFLKAIDSEVNDLHKNGVKLSFIGQLSAFAPELRERMHKAMSKTAGNTALALNVAVNYGGRWDIAQAARRVAQAAVQGEIAVDAIDETSLAPMFCLAGQPAVDLFIRTGGEQRISNFLLWQSAYSEFYFCEALWPAFRKIDFLRALRDYAGRSRRFGS